MSPTVVFTDGGCDLKDRGVGAFAYHAILPGGATEEHVDGCWGTTNNRMEMRAVLVALQRLEIGPPIRIVSDSEYVIKGITQWVHGWIANDWYTSSGTPVKNRDIWEKLHAVRRLHTVEFQHVKGHSGHPGNERVDALCTAKIKQLRAERKSGLLFEVDSIPILPAYVA